MNKEELKQRLIELVEEAMANLFRHIGRLDGSMSVCITEHLIANGVTIRERGEWVKHPHSYECSLCGNGLSVDYAEYYDAVEVLDLKFCPFCGADLRGGKDD